VSHGNKGLVLVSVSIYLSRVPLHTHLRVNLPGKRVFCVMLHTHIGSHFIQHQKHNKSQRKDVEKIEFYLSALLFSTNPQ
jgi:hypothetical protein